MASIFRRLACFLGMHQGEFYYQSTNKCDSVRECIHCGHRASKVAHTYGNFVYRRNGACEADSTCSRCGSVRSKAIHDYDFSTSQRKSATSCNLVHVCKRCGDHYPAGYQHDYGPWQSFTTAYQIRYCKRCNLSDTRAIPEAQPPSGQTRPASTQTGTVTPAERAAAKAWFEAEAKRRNAEYERQQQEERDRQWRENMWRNQAEADAEMKKRHRDESDAAWSQRYDKR